MTAQLRECRARASGLGVRPEHRWTVPPPGFCTENRVLSDLAVRSSSHIYRIGKVGDLGERELKILGKADEWNKGEGALERVGQRGFTLAALLKLTEPAA